MLGLVAVSFLEVARSYDGPRLAFQNVYRGWGGLTGSRSSTEEFIAAINDTQSAFGDSSQALEQAAEPGHKPSLEGVIARVAKSVDELKKVPSLGAKADNIASQFLALMQDQYELLQDVERGAMTMTHFRRASENARKYREITDSFSAWVDDEGQRYGIQLRKPR